MCKHSRGGEKQVQAMSFSDIVRNKSLPKLNELPPSGSSFVDYLKFFSLKKKLRLALEESPQGQ